MFSRMGKCDTVSKLDGKNAPTTIFHSLRIHQTNTGTMKCQMLTTSTQNLKTMHKRTISVYVNELPMYVGWRISFQCICKSGKTE